MDPEIDLRKSGVSAAFRQIAWVTVNWDDIPDPPRHEKRRGIISPF
jgi:hypothetical protein